MRYKAAYAASTNLSRASRNFFRRTSSAFRVREHLGAPEQTVFR
jgi:hypothetical protein